MSKFNEVLILCVAERPTNKEAAAYSPHLLAVCLEEDAPDKITDYAARGDCEQVEYYTLPVTHRPVRVEVG